MDRHTKLGIVAAALMAAPVPALAQTWPALAVTTAGHGAMGPTTRINVPFDASVWRAPPSSVAVRIPQVATVAAPARSAAAPLPEVKIPAKPEWTDDQGLRLHYAEVTYKQRF